jgi:hypothetical protein
MKHRADKNSMAIAMLVFICLGVHLPPAYAQTAANASPAHAAVALTPGTCARVAEGDIVTLQWDPAFTSADAVTGLQNLTLSFAKAGDGPRSLVAGHGVVLRSMPQRGRAAADTPIEALGNGYFHLRFRADLKAVSPGEYHLLSANAVARVTPGYQGEVPRMTNSPTSLPFCVEVTSLPVRGYAP